MCDGETGEKYIDSLEVSIDRYGCALQYAQSTDTQPLFCCSVLGARSGRY